MGVKMDHLKITKEYITLQQFLKLIDIIPSGGAAKYYLSEHPVLVNQTLESRRGRKLYPNDVVEVDGKRYELQ